jgi:hypothetical protein
MNLPPIGSNPTFNQIRYSWAVEKGGKLRIVPFSSGLLDFKVPSRIGALVINKVPAV